MKKIIPTLVFGSLISLSLFNYGCKKDRIERADLNEYADVNTYLDSKKQEEQEFIITGPSDDTIVGNQGSRIYGSKNCLQDSKGDTIDYPYTIKLVELYTPADMIYYQMPTVAGGDILETDGEIRLRAFKDSEELTVKPGCPYAIEMPNSSPKSYMSVFLGKDNGSFVDWTESKVAFTTTPYGYLAPINTLGWINCGNTIGDGTGHTINFTSSVDDLTNVGIFIYFPASKTVMQAYSQTSGLIPNGSAIEIVMIAIDGSGQLFTYTNSLTVNSNKTFDMSLSQITETALTTYLNNL